MLRQGQWLTVPSVIATCIGTTFGQPTFERTITVDPTMDAANHTTIQDAINDMLARSAGSPAGNTNTFSRTFSGGSTSTQCE